MSCLGTLSFHTSVSSEEPPSPRAGLRLRYRQGPLQGVTVLCPLPPPHSNRRLGLAIRESGPLAKVYGLQAGDLVVGADSQVLPASPEGLTQLLSKLTDPRVRLQIYGQNGHWREARCDPGSAVWKSWQTLLAIRHCWTTAETESID